MVVIMQNTQGNLTASILYQQVYFHLHKPFLFSWHLLSSSVHMPISLGGRLIVVVRQAGRLAGRQTKFLQFTIF